MRVKKYELAIKDFDKALSEIPTSSYIYVERGDAWVGKGDLDKALSDYFKSIELDPSRASSYERRASLYEKLGNKAKAEADRKKVNELKSKIPQ